MSYKEKFLAWYENEVKNEGLLSISLFPNIVPGFDGPKDEEEVYKDLLYIAENFNTFDVIAESSPREKQ